MWIKLSTGHTAFIVKGYVVSVESTNHGARIHMLNGDSWNVGYPLTQVVSTLGLAGPQLVD